MTKYNIQTLETLATEIRKDIIKTLVDAGTGHSAGPLGMTDVFVALYFSILKHDPTNPTWEERDVFILSNGHICPGLYVTMARAGYFPQGELLHLREINSLLQGHPSTHTPGIDTSTGPLGQGASVSVGSALGFKIDKNRRQVYCMVGDGELQEGQIWESAMLAGNKKLDNLTWIVDRNNIQIDGHTEEMMPLEPLREKFEAFNWHVLSIDGNNMRAVIDALRESKSIYERPVVIIANNVPGNGVEFMENDPAWHGKPPNVGEAVEALRDLNSDN